jgi:Flp pilus assembly protein TadB
VRRAASLLGVVAALALVAAPIAAADLQLTPVGRLLFPDRAYVVDLGRDGSIPPGGLHMSENGVPIRSFTIRPLAQSAIDSAVMLAIDASNSMAGSPYGSAVLAARAFASSRTGAERIGVVAFNRDVHVIQRPTLDSHELGVALDRRPALAYGTHIYDGVMGSLGALAEAGTSTGAIVLLSDGADVGSTVGLERVIEVARSQHVRIFTVGLVSKSYDPAPLRALAEGTGGSYYEATSAVELTPIYAALGQRLASQYLVRYRSQAVPASSVTLRLALDGVGSATDDYTAPKRSELAPFHRSLLKRFVLSRAAIAVLSLLVAAAVGGLLMLVFTGSRSGVVGRVEEFLGSGRGSAAQLRNKGRNVGALVARSSRTQGWVAKIDRELEIASINITVFRLGTLTLVATLFMTIVLALVTPFMLVLGLLTPIFVRSWVKRRLRGVRGEFGDQLPANLQVLASGMRSGHSFSGALTVMVDNADEPSRRELQRAVSDHELGIPADEAMRRVAERMASRDLHQVALLSELQRTSGGNAAEVLDTVVETIRERAEVRRLIRTLTAQGRMARWILTALPVFVAVLLTLIQPDVMRPLYTTTAGHVALVIAALMVVSGSMVIQKIVDIEV